MGPFMLMCFLPLLLLNSFAHSSVIIEKREEAVAGGLQKSRRATAPPLLHVFGDSYSNTGNQSRPLPSRPPLYVFGDSYADTGNHNPDSADITINKPWRQPYGSSWPGHPSGRYSNGRLLTDFYVSKMHLRRPVPFRRLHVRGSDHCRHSTRASRQLQARTRGINFAFGGSGVFSTLNPLVHNVSVQIEELRTTIDLGIVSVHDIHNSIALFVINGNDYTAYYEEHSSFEGLEDFILEVVEQMATDLQTLSDIGFSKFVVTTLLPVGCLPYFTYVNNYSACLSTFNSLSAYHNSILKSKIANLEEKIPDATFATIDLASAFTTIMQEATVTLRPCCEGSCGEVDEDGSPLYTMCSDPRETLFWDVMHPTNFGWRTIMDSLFSSSLETHHFPMM